MQHQSHQEAQGALRQMQLTEASAPVLQGALHVGGAGEVGSGGGEGDRSVQPPQQHPPQQQVDIPVSD